MRVGRAQNLWILLAPCAQSAKEDFWWNCHSSKAFLPPWTGRDKKKERDVVREMKEGRNVSDRLKFRRKI